MLNGNFEANTEPFEYTLSLIGGKWKMRILFLLLLRKVLRYGELRRLLNGITHKMLSKQLNDLQNDGLIIRKEYPQIPPKVEYSLSSKGLSLMPILTEMCKWGQPYINDNANI
nr:helix-turn-helix domain-containing protein [Vallitalea pronyensis]